MNFMTFHMGISSSQLTLIFFRGVETTNQIINDPILDGLYHPFMVILGIKGLFIHGITPVGLLMGYRL
jgi:hypothetical protein